MDTEATASEASTMNSKCWLKQDEKDETIKYL